jgi:hypothetical protein
VLNNIKYTFILTAAVYAMILSPIIRILFYIIQITFPKMPEENQQFEENKEVNGTG